MLSKDGVLVAIRCGDDTPVSVPGWPKDGATTVSIQFEFYTFGDYEFTLP